MQLPINTTDPNMRDLIERTRTDPEFKERVVKRRERELDRQRPLWRKRSDKYRQRETNRQKERARVAVKQAVNAGLLRPTGCAMLDNTCRGRIEAHHHLGYEDEHALDVVWLCRSHHEREDAKLASPASH